MVWQDYIRLLPIELIISVRLIATNCSYKAFLGCELQEVDSVLWVLNSDFVDEIATFENEIETVSCWWSDVSQLLFIELWYVNTLLKIFLVITEVTTETKTQRQNELTVLARANIDFIDLIVYSGWFV